jgi:hypothetical protein
MKVTKLKATIALLGLLSTGTVTSDALAAGTVSGTTVTFIYMNVAGTTAFAHFSNAILGRPACATVTSEMAFDATTTGGKSMLAALQTAMLSGKLVNAAGTGACTTTTTRENLSTLIVING